MNTLENLRLGRKPIDESPHVIRKPSAIRLSEAIRRGGALLDGRQIKHAHYEYIDGELYADVLGAAHYCYTREPVLDMPLFPLFRSLAGVDIESAVVYYPAGVHPVKKAESLLVVMVNLNDFYDFSLTDIADYLNRMGY
jgi:hypothetical protein